MRPRSHFVTPTGFLDTSLIPLYLIVPMTNIFPLCTYFYTVFITSITDIRPKIICDFFSKIIAPLFDYRYSFDQRFHVSFKFNCANYICNSFSVVISNLKLSFAIIKRNITKDCFLSWIIYFTFSYAYNLKKQLKNWNR